MNAFLVTGPESAGNRLLAAILTRAGCHGTGAHDSPYTDRLPADGEDPVVLIRSMPHGGSWPDLGWSVQALRTRGYHVTMLITVREPVAHIRSQVARGHSRTEAAARIDTMSAYQRIFRAILELPQRPAFRLVPYEGFVLHPEAIGPFVRELGLDWKAGPVTVERQSREVTDENAKHYHGRSR